MLFAAIAPLTAFAQFQAPTQEELSMTSDPKAPGAAAVYLYREEVEDDTKSYRSVYVRIKVLSEKGKELATVPISYQRNFAFSMKGTDRGGENQEHDMASDNGHFEIAAISGRTIHADGTVVPMTMTPSDLLEERKGGNQVNRMTFNLPSVEVGSILEYRYQLRYDRFLSPPLWQIQQPYFVRKERFMFTPSEIFLPTGSSGAGVGGRYMIDQHGQSLNDILATSRLPKGISLKPDALGRYELNLTDIPAIPEESYTPPLSDQIMKVNFYYAPSFIPKEFWQTEMKFWSKDLQQYTAQTEAIKEAAAEAVSAAESSMDKAKKLYALVQNLENKDFTGNLTSSSFNDMVPNGNVEVVLQRKYGNSKELTLLYLALARAAGLDARPIRIASRNQHIFDPTRLEGGQMDALVIGVNLEGKEFVLDPGAKMAPFQTLAWSHAGAGGVMLAADGKVETIVTPLQQDSDNTVVRIGKLTLSPEGNVTGALKVGFTGQDALSWRQQALRMDATSLQNRLEHFIQEQAPNGVRVHLDRIVGLDDPAKQLVAVIQVTGSLAQSAGKHLILPRVFFGSKTTNPFSAEESRLLPIDMRYAAQEQEQITYVLPSGYALEGAPQDASFKWEDHAAYQLRSKAEAGFITTARVLVRNFTLLDASDYGKIHDFYEKAAVADRQQLALTGTSTGGQ